LIYDIPPTQLNHVAALLSEMLKVVTEQEALSMTLGATESEDDLWGYPSLRGDVEELTLDWQAKLIPEDKRPRLLVIPNLANLSLAAARACLMVLGNEVVHLERHGRSQRSQPNIWCLAACVSDQIGAISPHLLDRFSLRLSGQMLPTPSKVQAITAWLDQTPNNAPSTKNVLPDGIRVRLRQAAQIAARCIR
jgi:magnesium chelatase subunit D